MHKIRHIEFSSSSNLYLQLIQLIMSFLCSMLCSCTEFEFIQRGFQYENLKMISLRSCEFITKLPDLCCPNLEKLDLGDCKNLIEVHESIGFLEKLKVWNLGGCSQLQILPSMLMLKSLKYFNLWFCGRLEKFPDIHPEMICLRALDLRWSGIRELPSSLLYLTGLDDLSLNGSKLTNFLVGANKSQMREEEDIPSAKLRLACNSFSNFSGPIGFQSLTNLDLSFHRIKVELDSWMQPNYFPVLTYLYLSYTGIVTIPESISKFTKLQLLEIKDCKKLRKIPRLPQSIRTVDAQNCDQLDTQSSSKLLNQFREILGILPNTIAQAATSFDYGFDDYLLLPAIEIPKWFEFNHHQSVGNSVSFLVGPKFSNLVVCIAIPSKGIGFKKVDIFINGEISFTNCTRGAIGNYGHVWLCYGKVNISNPSEENRIEVENAFVVLRNPIYLLPHLWIDVHSTMGKKIQAVLESDADCGKETIDQPMLDVPKNTTCLASDGFESDSNFGNEAPNHGDGE
ncbi:disease resistance protein adr2 [Quercus suber]|uniref:Disease resistance protein adr2 n=1 Tax=Quercus suber TaxID=58331 RepID=A0AAW0MA15_QUESU